MGAAGAGWGTPVRVGVRLQSEQRGLEVQTLAQAPDRTLSPVSFPNKPAMCRGPIRDCHRCPYTYALMGGYTALSEAWRLPGHVPLTFLKGDAIILLLAGTGLKCG